MRAAAFGLALLAAPAAAQMSPPVPPANLPANCTAAEHRQFDFWIGKWRVFRTDNPEAMLGASLIEAVYNGCGLRENWQPFTMITGGSLSLFDRSTARWRQAWIDSLGSRAELEGGMIDGKMVLTGLWHGYSGQGRDATVRITWSRLEGGAVRQLGESSTDGGKTWKPSFDFTYQPAR